MYSSSSFLLRRSVCVYSSNFRETEEVISRGFLFVNAYNWWILMFCEWKWLEKKWFITYCTCPCHDGGRIWSSLFVSSTDFSSRQTKNMINSKTSVLLVSIIDPKKKKRICTSFKDTKSKPLSHASKFDILETVQVGKKLNYYVILKLDPLISYIS